MVVIIPTFMHTMDEVMQRKWTHIRIPKFAKNGWRGSHIIAALVLIVLVENKIKSLTHLCDHMGASFVITDFTLSYALE
jgi:hypothetical protein